MDRASYVAQVRSVVLTTTVRVGARRGREPDMEGSRRRRVNNLLLRTLRWSNRLSLETATLSEQNQFMRSYHFCALTPSPFVRSFLFPLAARAGPRPRKSKGL